MQVDVVIIHVGTLKKFSSYYHVPSVVSIQDDGNGSGNPLRSVYAKSSCNSSIFSSQNTAYKGNYTVSLLSCTLILCGI